MLDYLGADPYTRAILLYIEAVTHARKFLSAARAAARNKHVLAVKAGRESAGARAAASHTGALAGVNFVYDAAIRRAGMLRVYTLPELFNAVETLSRARQIHGERLAILTKRRRAGRDGDRLSNRARWGARRVVGRHPGKFIFDAEKWSSNTTRCLSSSSFDPDQVFHYSALLFFVSDIQPNLRAGSVGNPATAP